MTDEIKDLNYSFRECATHEKGRIYADWMDGKFRCLIMRGPASLCGYVGVPEDHPYYGKNYSDLNIDCHGGLTFANEAHDKWPEGYWWYGWDYAHYHDATFFDHYANWDEMEWDPTLVYGEFADVIRQFREAQS